MTCYLLKTDELDANQSENDLTYIGGIPRLPSHVQIPICNLCGAEQSFFFVVAFPEDHDWHGLSVATFACTSCLHMDHLIPALLDGVREKVDIPAAFLKEYQMNFRFIVFPTDQGEHKNTYIPKIEFRRWLLKRTQNERSPHNKIGGRPRWYSGNESPATYKETIPMTFLLQIERDYHFSILPDALGQAISSYKLADGTPLLSSERYYKLFLANALYLFGTNGSTDNLVYAIVQS